jgi:hypothetical protein
LPKNLPEQLSGQKLPEREGLSSYKAEIAPLKIDKADNARPLHELASDTFFFNHGLMFSAGMLDERSEDPIADYWVRRDLPEEARPRLYTASRDLFQGLPPGLINWPRTLLLIKKPYAQGVYDHLRAFSAVDWRRKLFWHAVVGSTAIDDPSVTAGEPRRIPVILVEVSRGDASFEYRSLPTGLAVARRPPKEYAASMARAIFDESHTPFRAVEPKTHGEIPKVDIPEF